MWQNDVHGLLQVTVGDADPGWVSRGKVFQVLGVGVRELSLYLQVSGSCVYTRSGDVKRWVWVVQSLADSLNANRPMSLFLG